MEGRELKKSWTHGRTHGHSGDFILLYTIIDGFKISIKLSLLGYNKPLN